MKSGSSLEEVLNLSSSEAEIQLFESFSYCVDDNSSTTLFCGVLVLSPVLPFNSTTANPVDREQTRAKTNRE